MSYQLTVKGWLCGQLGIERGTQLYDDLALFVAQQAKRDGSSAADMFALLFRDEGICIVVKETEEKPPCQTPSLNK